MANQVFNRQIGVQSHRSIQKLTAQTNDRTLETQNIRRTGESIATHVADLGSRVEQLQAGLEWMAAVQAILPLEVHGLVRNAIAEDMRSASLDQQTLSNEVPRKQTLTLNPNVQNVSPLKSPGTLPASRRLDETSHRQSWEQFEEMEKDCLLPYQSRNYRYTTSPLDIQGQRTYFNNREYQKRGLSSK